MASRCSRHTRWDHVQPGLRQVVRWALWPLLVMPLWWADAGGSGTGVVQAAGGMATVTTSATMSAGVAAGTPPTVMPSPKARATATVGASATATATTVPSSTLSALNGSVAASPSATPTLTATSTATPAIAANCEVNPTGSGGTATAGVITVAGSLHPLVAGAVRVAHHASDDSLPVVLFYGPNVTGAQRASVEQYMQHCGFTLRRRLIRDVGVHFQGPAASAERMFGVTVNDYQNGTHTFYANDRPLSLPGALAPYVKHVLGLDNATRLYPAIRPTAADCSGSCYSPSQVANYYQVNALTNSGFNGSGQTIGILTFATFNNGPFDLSDVRAFESHFGLPQSNVVVDVQGSVSNSLTGAMETTLDTSWSSAMASGAKIVVVESANTFALWVSALSYLLNTYNPTVMSISWGTCEQLISSQDMDTFNQVTAVAGIPIFAATGDNGSRQCSFVGQYNIKSPGWPAIDPYVTAVGGTRLLPDSSGNPSTEVPWCDDWRVGACSDGGFSTHFSRPAWQSISGSVRGTPDVSLIARDAAYVFNGVVQPIGGTSLSAPALAGMLAVVNQARGRNEASLGPDLYGHCCGYNDVNPSTPVCNPDYCSGTGWDAVTGLGAINAYKLYAALTSRDVVFNVGSNSVSAGGTVTVNWSGIPNPTPGDWIGLYRAGAADLNNYLAYRFVNCDLVPTSAAASGSCAFPIPLSLAAGSYELRLFSNESYTRLASPIAITVIVAGFDTEFNDGSLDSWQAIAGSWVPSGGQWVATVGISNAFASMAYPSSYTSFDYQVALWRFGCDYCANTVNVRGVPPPLAGNGTWGAAYAFEYTRNGDFSVWLTLAGQAIPLQSWTPSWAINQGDAWNMLQVSARGPNLYFYINGVLVWQGSDESLTVGQVGVMMYTPDPSSGGALFVDWAKLNPVASTSTAVADRVGASQQALNDSANAHPVGKLEAGPPGQAHQSADPAAISHPPPNSPSTPLAAASGSAKPKALLGA